MLVDSKTFDERIARLRVIWPILHDVFGLYNTDLGWDIYFVLGGDGATPPPDQITPEIVAQGLRIFCAGKSYLDPVVLVDQPLAAYRARVEAGHE